MTQHSNLLADMRQNLTKQAGSNLLDLQAKQIESHRKIGELKQAIEEVESDVSFTIAGNPDLKNAEARKAAQGRELSKHPAWKQLQSQLRDELANKQYLEAQIADIEATRRALEVERKFLGHQAQLAAAELHYLASTNTLKAAGCQLKAGGQ